MHMHAPQIDAAAPAVAALNTSLPPVASERVGCGWFDSSYELNSGLDVVEDVDLSLFQLWSQAHALSRRALH